METLVFAYLGPETLLPISSIIAGAVGVFMMFGRNSWTFAKSIVRGAFRVFKGRREPSAHTIHRPHIRPTVESAPVESPTDRS